ncbi:tRNA dimethylallyltransferase-like [Oppia nitens]|uniref:tRNA dimethylallyltransferase-like n=1 Tax=Oppia nitens TaxID=1686743 RepID=UPI0023DA313B|nr:tRNA dimethylallyltransferase-like [Oppia nitens]
MYFTKHLLRWSTLRSSIVRQMSDNKIPLVVIIGATGCAKTKLSIDISKQINAEIISADSMQVYKDLDIITNKATHEERKLVRHHLIDFLDPLSRFSVVDFRNKTLEVINDLMSRGIVPILVGGTNYYIESILWEVLISGDEEESDDNEVPLLDREVIDCKDNHRMNENDLTKDSILCHPIFTFGLNEVSSDKLHQILEQLDPVSSQKIHPNDRRKVIRCLQIYQQKKKTKSELINEQMTANGGSQLGGPLRFKNSVILWVDCDKFVLNQRLDERVDKMIEKGLIEELLDFHQKYNKQRISQNLTPDYSQGIFQSIGFKEFHNYLLLTEDQRKNNPFSKQMLNQSIDNLKLVTKRYVKHQLKWIRNRFLINNDRAVPPIYRLDTTSSELWNQEVLETSMAIVNAFINSNDVPTHITRVPKLEIDENVSKIFICDICNKRMSGLIAYELHLKSKGHQYFVRHKKQIHNQLIAVLNSYESKFRGNECID